MFVTQQLFGDSLFACFFYICLMNKFSAKPFIVAGYHSNILKNMFKKCFHFWENCARFKVKQINSIDYYDIRKDKYQIKFSKGSFGFFEKEIFKSHQT